jgi:hypothetical protein
MVLDVRQQNHVSAKAAGRRPPLIDCFAIRWPDGECMHSPSGDCPLPGKALKVREKECVNYRLFQDLPLLLEDAVLVALAVIISHQIMAGASRHHFFWKRVHPFVQRWKPNTKICRNLSTPPFIDTARWLPDNGAISAMRAASLMKSSLCPWKPNRKHPGTLDRVRYARPNRIERMIGFATQFRRVATRYDKTSTTFSASSKSTRSIAGCALPTLLSAKHQWSRPWIKKVFFDFINQSAVWI